MINGFANIDNNRVHYDFDEAKHSITFYMFGDNIKTEEHCTSIIGQKYGMLSGGQMLFELSSPLQNDCLFYNGDSPMHCADSNQTRFVEYYIDNYVPGTTYQEMSLQFPELDFFIPSSDRVSFGESEFVIPRDRRVKDEFDVVFHNKKIHVIFSNGCFVKKGKQANARTTAELILKFDGTNDLDYLLNVYYRTRAFFAFICNRYNVGLRKAKLFGEYEGKTIENGKIALKVFKTTQDFFPNQKYIEPDEVDKVIQETLCIDLIESALQPLFQLFFEKEKEDDLIVNLTSIHRSRKYRNLIDLEHTIQITASFEHYSRTLLPEMSSESTIEFINDLRSMLEKYVETAKGEKKEKAKNYMKRIAPQISLEEKINKSFMGYGSWKSLEDILQKYSLEEVKILSAVANKWRNELAHSKHEYAPDENVIKAIRLVEKINYIILLRNVGYSDDVIKIVIEEILAK